MMPKDGSFNQTAIDASANALDPIELIGKRIIANQAAYPSGYTGEGVAKGLQTAREGALFEEWMALMRLSSVYQAQTPAGALIQLAAAIDSASLISNNAECAVERPTVAPLDPEQVGLAMNTVLRCLYSVARWVEKRDGLQASDVGYQICDTDHPDYREIAG